MLPADTSTAQPTTSPNLGKALPGAGIALTLLLAINLFNYIDRNVLAAVEPEIRKELFPDSEGPDATKEAKAGAQFLMGLLSTAFIISFMCTAPIFAKLADKWSHWLIIGVGVILWSLASFGSGVDWGAHFMVAFLLLLGTRLLVGVGEGAYGPVAPTMLADLFPVNQRGQVMTWFFLAIPVGAAMGYALGAWVNGNPALGDPGSRWRWSFYLVLVPGLLLGAICFFMRDPPRGLSDRIKDPSLETRKGTWHDYAYLMKIPSFSLNTIGMTAMNFGIGGLGYWMSAYLEERKTLETVDLVISGTTIDARTMFGLVTATSGLVGVLAGGVIGDWLRPRLRGAYFLVSGAVMILGFPMLMLFLYTPFPLAWVFGFFTVFCLFFGTGPTNAILANVAHPSLRATGFALNIFIIHAFGDAISPPVLGFIAGHTSLTVAFVVVSITMVLGGVLWIWGAMYLDRDTELAHTRLPELDPQLAAGKVVA